MSLMGEEHNVVFGQGLKVNRATSTLSSSSICLMRHIEGEESVLLALLTLSPCPKTTLCSSPIPGTHYSKEKQNSGNRAACEPCPFYADSLGMLSLHIGPAVSEKNGV